MTIESIDDPRLSLFAEAESRGDDDGVIEILDRVTTDWAKRIADIQTVLLQTSSVKVRNAAAVAPVDMNAKAACDTIVTVLRRPDIAPEAGTLLYALDELGASLPLDVAICLIENGSYETRAETLLLLQAGRITPFETDARDAAVLRLSAYRAAQDLELSEAAGIALEAITPRTEARPHP